MCHMQRITWFVLLPLFLVANSCAKTQDSVQARPKHYKVASVIDLTGSVSPDGRHYAFTDWRTGNLAVKDLETGKERHLTDKDSWLESNEYALSPRISPDGNQIAYCWNNEEGFCDLRLIGLDGSGARVLYRQEETRSIAPHDWSPDGKQVLARFGKHMVLISVADGSVDTLKEFSWSEPGGMRFSPDGRYIAYDMPPWEDSPDRDIFLLATDGSLKVPLLKHPAYEHVLDWTPDGRGLLFASDRDLPIGVGRRAWLLEIVAGRPQTDPELVKPEIGVVRGLGFGPDGSYYYCCGDLGVGGWRSVNDLYLATLDPGTGTLGPATKLVTRIGFRTSIEWSPDGRYLAYAWWAWPQPSVLGIRSLETGEERRLQLTIRLSGTVFRPQWSRDGRSLLVVARDLRDHGGTYRIDARSGEVTLVIQDCCEWGVWPNDETVIFVKYTSDKVGELRSIVVKELDTGLEKELYQAASPVNLTHLALSPDGRLLAFVRSNTEEAKTTLMVVPMAGGEPRTLVDLPPPIQDSFSRPILALVWTPDSRHVIYAPTTVGAEPDERLVSPFDAAEKLMLWRVPAEGGEPEEFGELSVGIPYGLSIHPDGLQIAIAAGPPAGDASRAEEAIWVLENFLPPPPTER